MPARQPRRCDQKSPASVLQASLLLLPRAPLTEYGLSLLGERHTANSARGENLLHPLEQISVIEIHPLLRQFAVRLVFSLGWHDGGILSVDLIMSIRKYYFNPLSR